MILWPRRLGLLDVGEVGVSGPRECQMQRLARAVRDNGAHLEPTRANHVGDANINRAFRDAVAVRVLFVSGLTGSATAWCGDLGMNVGESKGVRGNRRGLAWPWRVTVDAQL